MSFSDTYQFVAGDADFELHQLYRFQEVTENAAADLPRPAEELLALPPLGSPFVGPPEDLQGQVAGWISPSAPEPSDGLDIVNFGDFLALEGSTEDLSAPAGEIPDTPPPELAESSDPQDEPAAASEPAEEPLGATQLDAVRDEIAQLKAALAAEGLQPEDSTGDRQSSSNSRKCVLDCGEMSPSKRQITSDMGPIEALWSPKVTEGEQRAAHTNLARQVAPKPDSPQLNFTAPPFTPPINTSDGDSISPEDLHSIQQFLHDNPALVYGTSDQVDIATPSSDITMGHLVNTKIKRVPPKQIPKRVPKSTFQTANKVIKKAKTTPKKKTSHQRNASTTSNVIPSPDSSTSHRSIDELLASNFYSLNAQEKLRLMLPMLRDLDPRELEKNLATLPCIQAKGTGHEVTVAKAIRDSPPTVQDDDLLATKLTFGIPPSPPPAANRISSSPPAPTPPTTWTLPLAHNAAHIEISKDHGAVRQREALEKAAALQMQGKKR
ncbi:hypothetical protein E8E12_002351 [Didymella heteroderae]|uniref:Uncharacterized protein n=1 Tax=Didymella heteroderae TaxID=1769908 RepID=A0A9P4WPF9_9PLEO|nr:hypothetical protein E8E12_002351 [Didymella heteroderae]